MYHNNRSGETNYQRLGFSFQLNMIMFVKQSVREMFLQNVQVDKAGWYGRCSKALEDSIYFLDILDKIH